MKKFLLCSLVLLFGTAFVYAGGREVDPLARRPFSNFAVGVSAGTTGIGASVATPLCRHVYLRAGFTTAPVSAKFTYDDFDFNDLVSGLPEVSPSVADRLNSVELQLKGKLQMNSGHVLFDIVPFRRGTSSFFISAGLYFGSGKLVTVSGRFDDATMKTLKDCGIDITQVPVEIADVEVMTNADGSVSADLKVKSVKPYVGLGFGRPIPRGRVGFRFELGALFHGNPEVVSKNIMTENNKELNDVNKFLKDFKVYPQLNFQVTVRLLKDKVRR
ncbi:MAG: hypothetical protein NC250_00120 [Alistipes senegalensis]|nr:hypothetical protein [Bacteroides cellulosilyticus]MCM1351129.1 hypothetical protein [Alistipes senegalensis]